MFVTRRQSFNKIQYASSGFYVFSILLFFASQQYIENVLCDTQRENINLHI